MPGTAHPVWGPGWAIIGYAFVPSPTAAVS